MRSFLLSLSTLVPLTLSQATPQQAPESFTFHHENVLGTDLELRIMASSETVARKAERAALATIDRLDGILSRHAATSEFRRWQAGPREPVAVSPELLEVFARVESWMERSEGALNPAVQALTELWKQAEKDGKRPALLEIAEVRRTVREAPWKRHPDGRVERLTENPLTLDALAKGYVIDRACAAILNVPETTGALVNIGGDLRVVGDLELEVGIADPSSDHDNVPPRMRVTLRDGALATSGGYHRGFDIGGRHYAHIIDPRRGRPVEDVLSASVFAKTAMDADALATILCVLRPEDGLALVRDLDDVEAAVITPDQTTLQSPGWKDIEVRTTPDVPDRAFGGEFELAVDFEILRAGGGRYRRPYVAVWIEDAQGASVRTLCLWIEREQWLRDLRNWTKKDRQRKAQGGSDLVRTISRATRSPGKYSVLWDGKGDDGGNAPFGTYTVCIEVVREHGTYQIMRSTLELGEEAATREFEGNVEVGHASITYRKVSK